VSTRGSNSENRKRWIGWRQRPQISSDSAKGEPTKPSKPGFVGFVGAPSAGYAIILSPPGDPMGSSLTGPYRPSGNGAQRIQLGLDCSTETTRLMSWLGRKTAAPEWRGGVAPAKAEA
jgi:hypothetical protein